MKFENPRHFDISIGERSSIIEGLDNTNSEKTSKYLNFLAWEISIGPPKCKDWSLVYRLHHCSRVFGLIAGMSGGPNLTGMGIRYSFINNCSTFW